MLSTMMVNAGLTTFKKIEETNPREIEMVQNFGVKCQSAPLYLFVLFVMPINFIFQIVNRHPPFGSQVIRCKVKCIFIVNSYVYNK